MAAMVGTDKGLATIPKNRLVSRVYDLLHDCAMGRGERT